MSRRLLRGAAALFPCLVLAACGGGGGGSQPPPNPAPPVIQQYFADRTSYFVGESARLTVLYSGGNGRIEPSIGPVASGATVDTPALDVTTRYTLIVESANGSASRELTLDVAYRDRYRTLAQPFRASQHRAVLAGDGTVVIIGGSRGESTVSESIDRFDPSTETFTRIGSLVGGPFQGETATRLADGHILVVGARLQSGSPFAEIIDERTGIATATGIMNVPRLSHAAVALADDRVLITGGHTPEGFPLGISPTASIWDPATGQFRALTNTMNLPRVGHSATLLQDGRVLLVGGFSFRTPYLLAEIFDPLTEEFTVVPTNEQTSRALHESIRLQDGNVLVVGGENDATVPNQSVLLWDRSSGVFQTMPNLLVPRSLIRATATRADQVLLFGGVTQQHPIATASAETYTRAAGGAPLPPMPQARSWHTVTRLRDGRVLIVGGDDQGNNLVGDVLLYE